MKTHRTSLPAVLALAMIVAAPGPSAAASIVGFTPDSEYLLFVVDTSPSMRRFEWDRMAEMMREKIALYPTVRGIQVINDQGNHLIESFRNEWIPNTPTNQQWILDELGRWQDYSESNPRRGLLAAIDRYYDPEKSIAVILLSDDFSPGDGAVDAVVAEIAARTGELADGVSPMRIHGVAFPVFLDQIGRDQFLSSTGADVATLMTMLSRDHAGSFLALPPRKGLVAEAAESAAESDSVSASASASANDPAGGTNRVLIVVDDSTAVEPYWGRAVDSVEWLLAEAGDGDEFQVMTLTTAPQSLVPGTEGRWLSDPDGSLRQGLVARLRQASPAGTVDLGGVPAVIRGLEPAPDAVYILAASDTRLERGSFPAVRMDNPGGPPLTLLLFGAGDNPRAVPYYWALAFEGGGSLVAPAEDWP